MPVGATSYPAALDTLSTLIEQADGFITTLTANMTAGDTSMTVASTSGAPSTGIVVIEGENIGFDAKTATTFTGLTRGLFQTLGGSAAAAHNTPAAVEQLVIAGTHKVQNDAIIALETKLGIGADVPALNEFFVGTGAGSSGWRVLASGDVSTALGFTPADIAGSVFTGAISVDDGAGNVAASGSIRLRNVGAVSARNNADNADIALISSDASDRLVLRGGAGLLTSGGLLTIGSLVTTTTIVAGGAISGVSLAAGAIPAASGDLRMANDGWLRARNAGNTADIDLIKAAAGGSVIVGPASGITISSGGALTLAVDLALTEGGTGASTPADARTNLGLGSIATQASSAVSITGGSITGITDLAVADGGTGASTAANARTNLGLGTIATQAASAVAITGGSITGITDLAVADGGTAASDAATARTNLGLAIGTNVQAWDVNLDQLAGLSLIADRLPYANGTNTMALATFTAAGRALVDDADAAAQRTTLGLADLTNLQHTHTASGAQGGLLTTAAISDFDSTAHYALQSATIASDAVTLSGPHISLLIVDTEAAAATDNLSTISGGTNGQFLTVMTASSSRDVVLVDATGNLRMGGNKSLLTTTGIVLLVHRSGNWYHVGAAAN